MNLLDLVTPSTDLLAFGEPTHQEPAFGWIRNDQLVPLVEHGFRSIVLETDRVAALTVNDFVQGGPGDLDTVLREGFSHTFGDLQTNRHLVTWLRGWNAGRPAGERVAFHGFDASTEMMSAPSPRAYLAHARDYLGLDVDLESLAGDDERWSRTEAILDAAQSVGATEEAGRLRVIADDLLVTLYARAPELIAATSRDEWHRAETHLTAGLGLLRYHRQAAVPLDREARIVLLMTTRDALMARNLLDIRAVENSRGPSLVFASTGHLRRNPGSWRLADMDLTWQTAGAIVSSLVGERYVVAGGSLGRSEALGLGEPDPGTYEGILQQSVPTWSLIRADGITKGSKRTDTVPQQGYFPLDDETIAGVDAILHVAAGRGGGPEAGQATGS